MSSKKKPKTEGKSEDKPEAAAQATEARKAEAVPEGAAAETATAETAEAAEAPSGRQAELEAEIAEIKDKLLRSMAELENFRRRAEKEREDVLKYAISIFARDILTVADNLRRALESIPANARESDENLENLASGIELTERELLAAFERHGIKKVEPLGEMFDHDLHQAMFEVEDEEKPAGTIVEVMQPGYLLNDRLLRPAMVVIAKGGPPSSAAPASGEGTREGKAHKDTPQGEKTETGQAAGSGEDAQEGSKVGFPQGPSDGAEEVPPETPGRSDKTA